MPTIGTMSTDSIKPAGTGRASLSPHEGDAGPLPPRGAEAPERELVRRAQDGSVEAFGRLVERFEGRILALLRFRLRPEVDAEDVAQETFIRAWTRLESFDPARPLAPWLFTIAIRTAVAQNRKARSRAALNERAGIAARIGHPSPEGPGERDIPEAARIWAAARACLTDEAVTALWLRYGEEMSMREIGVALERNEIHVRVILSRARKRLREHMERLDSESDETSGNGGGTMERLRMGGGS